MERTDGNQEVRVELFDDFWGDMADEVVDVVVGDVPMLYLVGHGGGR